MELEILDLGNYPYSPIVIYSETYRCEKANEKFKPTRCGSHRRRHGVPGYFSLCSSNQARSVAYLKREDFSDTRKELTISGLRTLTNGRFTLTIHLRWSY